MKKHNIEGAFMITEIGIYGFSLRIIGLKRRQISKVGTKASREGAFIQNKDKLQGATCLVAPPPIITNKCALTITVNLISLNQIKTGISDTRCDKVKKRMMVTAESLEIIKKTLYDGIS